MKSDDEYWDAERVDSDVMEDTVIEVKKSSNEAQLKPSNDFQDILRVEDSVSMPKGSTTKIDSLFDIYFFMFPGFTLYLACVDQWSYFLWSADLITLLCWSKHRIGWSPARPDLRQLYDYDYKKNMFYMGVFVILKFV